MNPVWVYDRGVVTTAKRQPNKKYLTPKGRALAWITRIHRRLYQSSRGLIGSTVFQVAEKGYGFPIRPMKILLLTTVGRKSGLERTAPLPYFEYDGRTFIVASFAGGPKNPAWYHNLKANPVVGVHRGLARYEARATVLEGADRDHYWQRLVDDWPRYGVYQRSTERTIPLVELTRS